MITLMKRYPLGLVVLVAGATTLVVWAVFYPVVAKGAYSFTMPRVYSSVIEMPTAPIKITGASMHK